MSNFWARKLAATQPPPRPTGTVTGSTQNRPWWSSGSPPAAPEPTYAPQEELPPGAAPGHHVIQPSEINLRKLPSTMQRDSCPSCDSPDYFAATPNTRKRCFGCGYPLLHTTSGMSSTTKGERGTPARQVSNMTVTNESGRIIGSTHASAGAGGEGNYYPQDTRAGSL